MPGLTINQWTAAGAVAAIVTVVIALAALIHQIRSSRRPSPASPAPAATASSVPPVAELPGPVQLELKLSWLIPTYGAQLGEQAIGLTLINRLPYAVVWSSAAIEINDGSGRQAVLIADQPPGLRLPQTVAPQTSGFTTVAPEALASCGVNLKRPIVGSAVLATGDSLRSAPWTPR